MWKSLTCVLGKLYIIVYNFLNITKNFVVVLKLFENFFSKFGQLTRIELGKLVAKGFVRVVQML